MNSLNGDGKRRKIPIITINDKDSENDKNLTSSSIQNCSVVKMESKCHFQIN